jgi:hypothetical protein
MKIHKLTIPVNFNFRSVLCLQKLGKNFALGACRIHMFLKSTAYYSSFFVKFVCLLKILLPAKEKWQFSIL